MVYKKRLKKIMPKKPIKFKDLLRRNNLKWDDLSDVEKKNISSIIKESKIKYNAEKEKFKCRKYDMPKKPKNAFQLYITERMPILLKNKGEIKLSKCIEQIAKEWNLGVNIDKEKYMNKAKINRNNFNKQLEHFKKYGYYKKNNEENKKEDNAKVEAIVKDE